MEYERPNTVSGLLAKHKELVALRDRHQAEVERLNVSLRNLEAVVPLFDPSWKQSSLTASVTKASGTRGSVRRHVLDAFREADAPMTSRDVVDHWAKALGIVPDRQEVLQMRKQVGAAIRGCAAQKLIECVGEQPGERSPLKLWRTKRGG